MKLMGCIIKCIFNCHTKIYIPNKTRSGNAGWLIPHWHAKYRSSWFSLHEGWLEDLRNKPHKKFKKWINLLVIYIENKSCRRPFLFFIEVILFAPHQISSCTSSISKFNFHNIKINFGNENLVEKKIFWNNLFRTTILSFEIYYNYFNFWNSILKLMGCRKKFEEGVNNDLLHLILLSLIINYVEQV